MARTSLSPRTPARQCGAALLVFMLIFFLASMSWLLSQTDALQSRARADQTTAAALAQAREALIGRAAADKERPGSLPCPDFDDDGEATNGSCSVTVGRLPWKTLDLPDLRDGEGNRLWYALASELRDNGLVQINPTSTLNLSLDGTANIAAIVFSAGPPLAGQNERPSNDLDDYLDGANQDGNTAYVSGPTSPTFNDKTISISHDQLFSIVNRRILGQLNVGLEKYYNAPANTNLYPEDGADLKTKLDPHLDIGIKTMLDANGWYAITSYTPAPNRKSASLAITVPPAITPAITCTIAPEQKPVCIQP